MGVGYELICHDCKIRCGLGYGSYASWVMPHEKMTIEEFDKKVTLEQFRLNKNKNLRWSIQKHSGHNFEFLSEDMLDYEGLGLKAQEYELERPPYVF